MDYRVATRSEAGAVTETIRLAFSDDPVWGPALAVPSGSTAHLDAFWRFYVDGGLRFAGRKPPSGVWLTGAAADSLAIWTPPGESELSPEQEAGMLELVDHLPAGTREPLLELFGRFDSEHPHVTPHAYLGLLATHPDHRGRGIGQQLLAQNLVELDARGVPAYLESTNPANLHRYLRAGFEVFGSFVSVLDQALITTMWREPRKITM
jgi:GNAT superfamily N-acetyltransferase